jgi:hypothetical protein
MASCRFLVSLSIAMSCLRASITSTLDVCYPLVSCINMQGVAVVPASSVIIPHGIPPCRKSSKIRHPTVHFTSLVGRTSRWNLVKVSIIVPTTVCTAEDHDRSSRRSAEIQRQTEHTIYTSWQETQVNSMHVLLHDESAFSVLLSPIVPYPIGFSRVHYSSVTPAFVILSGAEPLKSQHHRCCRRCAEHIANHKCFRNVSHRIF